MIYTEEFTLSTLICDEDDRLTLWGLARLFQDVAGDQSDSLGTGFEGLKPLHKAWVLTNVYYNIIRFPSAGERLTLKTWAKADNGLIAPRDYELVDADGKLCAASASNWVIIDMDKRRVCRLGELIAPYEKEDRHATKYAKLEKIVMPAEMALHKQITVPYSSLDHTRHVNNAEYIKWICDEVPELCQPRSCGRKEISEFEINYIKETRFGDTNVRMFTQDSQDSKYFQLQNSNGVAVNARLQLT